MTSGTADARRSVDGTGWGRVWVCVLAAVLALGTQGANAQAAEGSAAPVQTANERSRQERQRISEQVWRNEGMLAARQLPGIAGLSDDPGVIEQGRRIYVDGMRDDGRPLVGIRLDGQIKVSGAAAACSLCHRASGLGAVEGSSQISPISGRYLFDQDRRAIVNMNLRARKSFNQRHDPYTLSSLAIALRQGGHQSGRALDPLMPRYQLGDSEVLALASYLRHLSNSWSPGVSDTQVELATVIAPDVDPERKRIFLATLNAIVAQKNGNLTHGQRTMSSGAEMVLQTDRKWAMQVWELQGAPSTWQAQLELLYAKRPVFALASGLGAGNWSPVHGFCEKRGIPCWFPSVGAVPRSSTTDFYSIYLSRGALLEADVLAQRLPAVAKREGRKQRLLQVYGDTDVADTAVRELRTRLSDRPIEFAEHRLGGDDAKLQRLLADLGEDDIAAFWLTPRQLESLARLPVPRAKLFFSGALGGGDKITLNAEWRAASLVVYPYQLPELRQRGMTVFKEFLRVRSLPLEDEVLQSEVYFALDYLNDTLVDMLDNLHRDYLLERGENMLSLREAARAEDEARNLSLPRTDQVNPSKQPLRAMGMRPMIPRDAPRAKPGIADAQVPGMGPLVIAARTDADTPATNTAVSRLSGAPESTNVYPHMSLGQLQRHASKGAYIVRLGDVAGGPVRAETDWIVP